MEALIMVEGMMCNKCKGTVTNAVLEVKGVEAVEVNLEAKSVKIQVKEATIVELVKEAIEEQGYDVIE